MNLARPVIDSEVPPAAQMSLEPTIPVAVTFPLATDVFPVAQTASPMIADAMQDQAASPTIEEAIQTWAASPTAVESALTQTDATPKLPVKAKQVRTTKAKPYHGHLQGVYRDGEKFGKSSPGPNGIACGILRQCIFANPDCRGCSQACCAFSIRKDS